MFSREVVVFTFLTVAVLSTDLSFTKVDGNRDIETVFIWSELSPLTVECHGILDASDDSEKMKLWWKTNGEKTADEFTYNGDERKISVQTKITYSINSVHCLLGVVNDEGEVVVSVEKSLPLEKIKLSLAAQPNMIAALDQSLTLSCKLSGHNFESVNSGLELKVHDIDADTSVSLEGGAAYLDEDGHIIARFTVPTDKLATKKYRCDVTDYSTETEVGVDVEIIGLVKDLSPVYVIPEDGIVEKLVAEVKNFDWAESGYPKITFTLAGIAQASTTGHNASEVSLGVEKSPASFKVEYKGDFSNKEIMFAPNFVLVSTTAEIRELKIKGETNVIETNSFTITCTIKADSISDFEIKLKRNNNLIDSSIEPRMIKSDSFESNELKYTFAFTDANKESDEGEYKCVIVNVAESNPHQQHVYKLEQAEFQQYWLLHARDSSSLLCEVDGVELTETIKWRDEVNDKDLQHGVGGYDIVDVASGGSTTSKLILHKLDTAGNKRYSCSLGDKAKHTFNVEIIAPTVTADIVFVTDDLGIDKLVCIIPDDIDTFTTAWKAPDGSASNSISEQTGQFTCLVYLKAGGSPSDSTATQLTVDVYSLSADYPAKTIYYKPKSEQTLTCETSVQPDIAANLFRVQFSYQFLDDKDSVLQNSDENTYKMSPNSGDTIRCIVSVAGLGETNVKAGTVSSTFSLRERKIFVTVDGTRYVYETPDSVSLTCRMSATTDENIDFGPVWYKDDKIYTSTGNFEKVADQDFVEHVLTFSDGIKLEDAGKYTCRLSHLESDAELNLVVETVWVSPDPLLKVFWMETESVAYTIELGRVGTVLEYKVDTSDGQNVDMTCDTAEFCQATLSFTRTEGADEDKSVTVEISAKNDVSNNFLLGDVLNIPSIQLTLHERTITGSAPTFWTKGYPLEMECTARAENNVEIKFVRRTEDEDIDVNEVTEQTEYNSKTMSRKGSLIIDTQSTTEKEIITYHCIATYEKADSHSGFMSTSLATSSFVLLDKPLLQVVGELVTKTEDGRFIVPEGASFVLRITYDSRAKLDCTIESDAGPLKVETKDGTGEYAVEAATKSHSGKYYIDGKYTFDETVFELGRIDDFAEVVFKEIENSSDYVEPDEGITLTVRFPDILKPGTVQWQDEQSGEVYRPTSDKKRDTSISVTQQEDYTVMSIPPGNLAASTSFKVSATLQNDEEVKQRQYIQVVEKEKVTKRVPEETEVDVVVVLFIALDRYNSVPEVTTSPPAKHVFSKLIFGMFRNGIEFTVTVTPETAKSGSTMTMTIKLNADSTIEPEILFEILKRPIITIDKTMPVNEGTPLQLSCDGDENMASDTTTSRILVNGEPAKGIQSEKQSAYDVFQFTIESSSYIHHRGEVSCEVTYIVDRDTVSSVSEVVEVSITEYESSTDYVMKGGSITLTALFPGTVDLDTVVWEDEKSGKTYKMSALEISAGIILESTSFKVSASLRDAPSQLNVRKYLQVVAPVSTTTLYDISNSNNVVGKVEIPVDSYIGEPLLSRISTTVLSTNFTTTTDKVTLEIRPFDTKLEEGGEFEITGTIKLNDDSSVDVTFSFYGIDITVERAAELEAGQAIVYNEMTTEEKKKTAFSCTFKEPPNRSSTLDASITHGDDNTELESIKIVDNALTVTFEDLAVEMDREVGEGEKEEKEEVYKCNFVVETPIEGVSGNFHREFIVKFEPAEDKDLGGVIAACVLAGIILLLLIMFVIYRCCIVKKRKKEKSVPRDMKLSGGPIQETNLASPETHPKFNDAVNFLDKVEARFKKEPDIYRTFLNTLTEYRAKKINKPDLARKVGILFEGHPDLVTEFNEFIKSKKKTDAEGAENEYTVIDTEGNTNGEVHVNKQVTEGTV
ncbi:hypothetical protein ACHWQZ_G006471 [Mnemiopsis leidyi]